MLAAVALHLRVDPLGGVAQGELAQGDKVALAEEVRDGLRRLVRDVDLALLETTPQVLGGQVHQLHLVGLFEDGVGHRLAHDHARDPGNHVVQRLQVLDVERRVDVDASVEQLEHVLPALGVAALGSVGVRQLVDEQEGGMPRQGGIEIELLEGGASVLDAAAREDLEAFEQRFGLGAAVRLDHAGDNVEAGRALSPRPLEHRVRFAHAGGGAEEDLQLAAAPPHLLFSDADEQLVGIGASLRHAAMSVPLGACRAGRYAIRRTPRGGRSSHIRENAGSAGGGEPFCAVGSSASRRATTVSASWIRPRFTRSQPSQSTEIVTTAASSSDNLAASLGTDVSINQIDPTSAVPSV